MPRLLADAFFQQATVQPVVDEIALMVKPVSGGSADIQQWQTSAGVYQLAVNSAGNLRAANTKGTYFDMASGNQGYVLGSAANDLDIRGGSSGVRILNNAGSSAIVDISDAGLFQLLDPLAVRIPTPTHYGTTVPSGSTGPYQAYNPFSRFVWHDLLAFNRWWGAPTFETFTGSWAADTLNNALWSQKEDQAITVIDGVTKTAARWTWNSGNIAFCYVDWWLLAFTYAGATASLKNILIETSSNGTAWTTVHSSTGNTANGAPAYFFAPINSADTWCRLTITVTNGVTLPMSSIRALSSRWGNQGGGQEYSFPYSWDATQRLAIGPAAVVANGNLTIGTNTTVASGGLWFGTDTPLYRSGGNALAMTGALAVAGAVSTGALTADGGGGVLSLKPGAADHTYMALYARTATATTRTGFFGFPSAASTTLQMTNEISGGIINLTTTGGGAIQGNGSTFLRASDLATPAITLGTAAAAGSTSSPIRSDSTIAAFDATVPSTQAFGDAAATGSVAFAARRDHKHAMPAGVAIAKNSGATVGTRPRINLIEGSNVTLTVADDAGNGEVDVTIAAASGGGTTSIGPMLMLMGA